MPQKRARIVALVAALATFSCANSKPGPLTSDTESDPGPEAIRRAPCRGFNPSRNVYFGDLHVHTSYSFDAFAWGTRTDPAGAYAFAKGEPATLGTPPDEPARVARLERPLDFAAVTYHSEFFGEYPPGMFTGDDPVADAWIHEQRAAE